MSSRVAIALCVHHKPWLVMSTLISLLLQDEQEWDLHLIYNVGDGACLDKPSYRDYREAWRVQSGMTPDPAIERDSVVRYEQLARTYGVNPKLSPFDERVRRACQLRGIRLHEHVFENDHALDSGAWYKFIRSGQWRNYEYVFCIQEGTLFTRTTALSAALLAAEEVGIHFLASAHYKARAPKQQFLHAYARAERPLPMDCLHDEMVQATFRMFCRDPEFRALFEAWSDEIRPVQQNHVPDLWRNRLWHYLRNAAESDGPLPGHPLKRRVKTALRDHRELFPRIDEWVARARVALSRVGWANQDHGVPAGRMLHVSAQRRPVNQVVDRVVEIRGVRFHLEAGPEWHGCHCNHLFSRPLLERLSERLDRYGLYEVLDLPFAGTALEVIWGFLPAWLGYEKWFFDGLHRVSKNFATYRREDDPAGMASYLNRYYGGLICIGWAGDYLTIRRMSKPYEARLRERLDPIYFHTSDRRPVDATN